MNSPVSELVYSSRRSGSVATVFCSVLIERIFEAEMTYCVLKSSATFSITIGEYFLIFCGVCCWERNGRQMTKLIKKGKLPFIPEWWRGPSEQAPWCFGTLRSGRSPSSAWHGLTRPGLKCWWKNPYHVRIYSVSFVQLFLKQKNKPICVWRVSYEVDSSLSNNPCPEQQAIHKFRGDWLWK